MRLEQRLSVLTVALGVAVGAACTDLNTGPDSPFALEILELPSPAIVRGDSLRDIDGTAVPLRAVVFNLDGDTIQGA